MHSCNDLVAFYTLVSLNYLVTDKKELPTSALSLTQVYFIYTRHSQTLSELISFQQAYPAFATYKNVFQLEHQRVVTFIVFL